MMLARTVKIVKDWPAHIATVLLIVAVVMIAPHQYGILIFKACVAMIGSVVGYWIYVAFLRHQPDSGNVHDRWQMVALMCAAMIVMGLGA